jgi:hypothetical protein
MPGHHAPQGLFAEGPDNRDIIPSGPSPVHPSHSQRVNFGPQTTPGAAAGAALGTAAGHFAGTAAGNFAGAIVRSASIERIVVFYKDKTFSEYRPETVAM